MTKHASLRIVVIDDDPDTTDTLVWLLQMDGHEVTGLYGGQDAVEKACAFDPDVILLDLEMPVANGYELAREIRKREQGKELLLIAVTGYTEDTDRALAIEAGFDHYLVKPIEFSALSQLLKNRDQS